MERFNSDQTRRARLAGGLLLAPLLAVMAAACGSPSHPPVSIGGDPGAAANATPTPSSTGSTGGGSSSAVGGKSMTWTGPQGYVYQISLASSGVVSMTSFTTDDGTGDGGTSVDAPPGSKILVAQVVFNNQSGRSEPMTDVPIGNMPADSTGSQFILAVPQSDASAFGIDPSTASQECSTSNVAGTPDLAPAGYCSLSTEIGAFSPAQSDITQPPQLDPGATGTVTFITAPTTSGGWVPQAAPVSDVKVFVAPNTTCYCWSPLGQ